MHVEIHNPAKFDSGEDDLGANHGQDVASEHRPLLNLPRQSQGNNRPDGALQGGSGPLVNTTDCLGFEGVAASGYAPPDTNMAVGPNHIVQWVNVRFAIYDKSGNMLSGYPEPGNAFWAGFGGPCQDQNSGDPIIQYDAVADRWIASQFTSSGPPYYQCFAISQTPHEALVVNHSVTAGTSIGVRWYEIRSPGASPTVFQQGTFAPDSSFRWMGSAAMDHVGNIAVGYSVSSTALNPAIRFTGRAPTDPLGTLGTELNIQTGAGSQLTGLSRWGDYSAMRVDPFGRLHVLVHLRIHPEHRQLQLAYSYRLVHVQLVQRSGEFRFQRLGDSGSQTVVQGNGTSYTATISALNGFSGSVALSASGLPSGASASFSPTSVTGNGSSTMTVSTGVATPAGTYTVTVTGTSGALVHSTTVTLVVQAVPAGDFSLSSNVSSRTVAPRGSATYTITINKVNGFNGTVTFSVSGLPARTSATFSPTSSTTATTLTVKANPNAKTTPATPLTITGTSGSLSRTVQVTIAIQ